MILRRVEQVVVDAVAQRAQQRIVGVVIESHGKTGAETGGAGDAPSIGQAIVALEKALEGQCQLVARHKVVPSYHTPKSRASREVQGIELLPQIRALIDRLAVGISHQKIRSLADVAEIRFQRVVIRIPMVFCEVSSPVVGTHSHSRSVIYLAGAAGNHAHPHQKDRRWGCRAPLHWVGSGSGRAPDCWDWSKPRRECGAPDFPHNSWSATSSL